MTRKLLVACVSVFLLCTPLSAQTDEPRYEVGVKAGVGDYSYFGNVSNTRAVFGFETCIFCDSRYALFGTYIHLQAPELSSRYQSADLFSIGLRIQGRGMISPFFDAGFLAGNSRSREYRYGTKESTATAGLGLGAGVAFRAKKGIYVRPQLRMGVMSKSYVAVSGEIAIGWRF
jgi:hypothetical protein